MLLLLQCLCVIHNCRIFYWSFYKYIWRNLKSLSSSKKKINSCWVQLESESQWREQKTLSSDWLIPVVKTECDVVGVTSFQIYIRGKWGVKTQRARGKLHGGSLNRQSVMLRWLRVFLERYSIVSGYFDASSSTTLFNIEIIRNEQEISILELYLKDHVTLNTGLMEHTFKI